MTTALLRTIVHVLMLGVIAAIFGAQSAAEANWLTKILSEAGEAGGKGAARGLHHLDPDLGSAVRQLKALPEKPGFNALAADAGSEGHWRFVNRKGEIYTAGNADEHARVRDQLLPGSTGKLSLYLTPDTVFDHRAMLQDLPPDSELFIATKSVSHRIVRAVGEGREVLYAEARPNLRVRLTSADLFAEALFHIDRPLKPKSLRILSLETGSADGLTAVPRFDPANRAALVDRIDPQRVTGALNSVRGQTVILTGRVEGKVLRFIDAAGGDGSLSLDALRAAARDADVNLVIVRAETPRQPGGRNWLWQTTSIPGLDTALKQPTFGDFLASLGARDAALTVTAQRDGFGRVVIEALPPSSAAAPITDTLTGWVDALAGDVMGRIAVAGIEADVRDKDRQTELDWRFIPGIPSVIQIGYMVSLALGLFGLGTAWGWWGRIWPPEDRGEYGVRIGYVAARGARAALFALIFLPLIGLPIFLRYVWLQIWGIVTIPFRVLRWLRDRLIPRPG